MPTQVSSAPIHRGLSRREELLRSTTRFARLCFDAQGASVFLLDDDGDDLVLEATSRDDEDCLLGVRLPAYQGVAGWVLQSGEAVIVDTSADPHFDRAFAESTGYVPASIIAVPLETGGQTYGVIEVLDPKSGLDPGRAIELAAELGRQCCAALAVLDALPSRPHDAADSLTAELRRLVDSGDPAANTLVQTISQLVGSLTERNR
jgi:GAF domain-containing protein